MASFNDTHPELASVKWRVLGCELGDAVEQSGGVEFQAERKRRLQGRVKAVASRVAGNAPPGVRRVAFEREPFAGRASDGSRPITSQPKRQRSLSGGGVR